MTDTGPLLAVSELARSFGDVVALRPVSLTVGRGEAVVLTGPNGSGKTTLLRCVAGADRPSGGTVLLSGRPLHEHEAESRRLIAAVLDDIDFFADLTITEHLALLMCAHGVAEPDSRAADLLAEAGLSAVAGHRPAALSSGQRRRLALITCFARPRAIVLMDEPEQRLDRAGRRWLAGRLAAEKDLGHGVLIATHDRRLADSLADRIINLGGSR
jgi:ABC-type multidrug transport system ATPase subunit